MSLIETVYKLKAAVRVLLKSNPSTMRQLQYMYYQNVFINEDSTSEDEPVDEINDFLNRVEKFKMDEFKEDNKK